MIKPVPLMTAVHDPLGKVAVHKVVVPFEKVTVPVGVPVAGGAAVTVGVNVADLPEMTGLGEYVAEMLTPAACALGENPIAAINNAGNTGRASRRGFARSRS